MKDLEVVSRPMPSWRVQQTFVPMEAAGSLAALGISAAALRLRSGLGLALLGLGWIPVSLTPAKRLNFVALSRNAPSRFLRMTVRYEGGAHGPTEVGPFIAPPRH